MEAAAGLSGAPQKIERESFCLAGRKKRNVFIPRKFCFANRKKEEGKHFQGQAGGFKWLGGGGEKQGNEATCSFFALFSILESKTKVVFADGARCCPGADGVFGPPFLVLAREEESVVAEARKPKRVVRQIPRQSTSSGPCLVRLLIYRILIKQKLTVAQSAMHFPAFYGT